MKANRNQSIVQWLSATLFWVCCGTTVCFAGHAQALTPVGTTIPNVASITHSDSDQATLSNKVDVTVEQFRKVSLTSPPNGIIKPGQTIARTFTVTNLGNGIDTFNLQLASSQGLIEKLYGADGLTPLIDSNGDGVVDTGLMAPGGILTVTLVMTAPADVMTGVTDNTVITSRSTMDGTVAASVTTLTLIPSPHVWELLKSVTPAGQVTPATVLAYTNTFANSGAMAATNVVITDQLDANLLYQPGSAMIKPALAAATVVYDPATRTLAWSIPSLPAGYNGAVSFKAQVAPATVSDTTISGNFAISCDLDTKPQVSNTVSTLVVEQPLKISKQADRPDVERGGFMGYRVVVENTSKTLTATQVTLSDHLPRGFRYVADSSKIDGTAASDPLTGKTTSWQLGDIPPLGKRLVSYRTIVSFDAPLGNAVNPSTATGFSPGGNSLTPVSAAATVKVFEGLLNSRATILGRVFLDSNGDRMPDGDEAGVKGVRLYLEDGSYAITDGEGKFSFSGIEAGDHVLKIDRTTIPPHLEPEALDSTFAADGNSRFVPMPFGGMGRGDFGLIAAKKSPASKQTATPAVTPAEKKEEKVYQFSTIAPPVAEPLEKRITSMPATLEILEPANGVVSRTPWSDIVVRVPDGPPFSLSVNNRILSEKQIGKTIVDNDRKLRICQFVGVKLDQGVNRIVLEVSHERDRTELREIEVIVPGDPVKLQLTPAKVDLPANGAATTKFSVTMLDKWDRPVAGEQTVTILSQKGTILEENVDPSRPGHHVRLVNGTGSFTLRSGFRSGADKLRIIAGTNLSAEADLYFTPVPREWLVAGIGSFITGFAADSGKQGGIEVNGDKKDGLFADGRFAFFAKGGVADSYLVTAAYDTNDTKRDELFQRSAPDKYYPIYGDSSEKGYEAESQTKRYLKVEKDRSSMLYGDFRTDISQNEFSRYDRSFNGIKADIDGGFATLRAFGSSTNHAANRDEIPGNGTSGYYYLSKKPIIENTERIRIEIRDRYHPERVISVKEKHPYNDYSFDFYTGAILFREPVPTLDANLNPVRIVVIYETEIAGDDHYVYGGRGALRSTGGSELGATAVVEETGVSNDTLYGVDGKLVITEKTALKVEAAQSSTVEKGDGSAWKTEFSTQFTNARLEAYYRHIDTTFKNPSMTGNEIGTEKYGVKGSYRLSEPILLLGESFYQSDLLNDTRLTVTSAGVSQKLDTAILDYGVKYVRSRETSGEDRSAPMVYGGVGGKLSDRLEASLLREQAFTSATPKDYPTRTIAKATYQMTKQTSAFVTQELQESGEDRKNSTVAGISTKLSDRTMVTTSYQNTTGIERSSKAGAEIVSKWELAKELTLTGKTGYQMENSMTGDRGQALLGVDTSWLATKNLRLGIKAERVHLVSGTSDPAGVNTALALSSEYLVRDDMKIGGRYELRDSPNEFANLVAFGGAWKLSREVSLLSKASYWMSDKSEGMDTLFDGEIGGAYRPLGKDSLYLLGMLRFKADSKGSAVEGVDSRDLIGSVEFSRRVAPWLTFHNKYAGKMSWYESSSAYTDLILAGVVYDIDKYWDVGIDAKLMNQYQSGLTSYGIVPKISYLLQKNLKLGIGYNLADLNDRDLSGESYQAQGPFVELKFKFDEITIEELYRGLFGSPPVVEEPPVQPLPAPKVTAILKAMLSEDPVEVYGSARSLQVYVNDRQVVLPSGDVTVRCESADEVIDIKGSELSKPLEFRIEVADPAKVSTWLLVVSSLDGTTLRTIRGEGDPGTVVSWDGRTENGSPLKGGEIYQYQLEVEYQDGSRITSPFRRFGLNRTSMISLSLSGGAFVTDSAVLSRKARKILSETAELLRKYSEEKIIVDGHTDSVGSVKYNIGLSRRRSQSAADYLIKVEKIPAERIVCRWFGKSMPIASNKFAEGRALNRRVDVKGEFRDLKRPEIIDQTRVAPFVRINRASVPIDQNGRFASKLASRTDRVEIEMGDENGRSVRKALDLPNVLLLEPAVGETRIIHQQSEQGGATLPPGLKIAYTFSGSVTKGSRLTLDGTDVPIEPDGRFSLILELHEGENIFWLHVVSPEGYGKYVRMAASLVRENGTAGVTLSSVPLTVKTEQKTYTLAFGEYTKLSDLEAVKAKLAAEGLKAEVKPGKEVQEPIFRLHVAEYSAYGVAQDMLEKLHNLKAAGFIEANGNGGFRVYAGSFQNKTWAKNEQKRLITEGIKTELMVEQVSIATYRLFAGSFDSLRAAVLEAAKLEGLGVTTRVVEEAR